MRHGRIAEFGPYEQLLVSHQHDIYHLRASPNDEDKLEELEVEDDNSHLPGGESAFKKQHERPGRLHL